MYRVIVTGATSFLGRNFVNGLLEKGYEVYAMVRKSSPHINQLPIHNNLKYIYGTLDDIEIITRYVDRADLFVHFAWDGSGNWGRADETIQQKNVEYSLNALNVAIGLGCQKFVFPGSQAEYGRKYSLIDETEECNPVSPYGKAKIMFSKLAEKRCENTNTKFIHLRIFSVYGYGDREGTLVDSCIKKMNAGMCAELGACIQRWNYLYIDDFVNVTIKLIEANCDDGIYNIASNDTRSLKDFVSIIYQLSNKSGSYTLGNVVGNPEGSPSLEPNIDKLINQIGKYEFVNFEEGIKQIMEKIGV